VQVRIDAAILTIARMELSQRQRLLQRPAKLRQPLP
jgi:hypothetical protein